jgi:hypothetical protein
MFIMSFVNTLSGAVSLGVLILSFAAAFFLRVDRDGEDPLTDE